jgi:hypothetical protein
LFVLRQTTKNVCGIIKKAISFDRVRETITMDIHSSPERPLGIMEHASARDSKNGERVAIGESHTPILGIKKNGGPA